jgi:hypothetical protein
MVNHDGITAASPYPPGITEAERAEAEQIVDSITIEVSRRASASGRPRAVPQVRGDACRRTDHPFGDALAGARRRETV